MKVTVVTSAKGGVGRTTIALNLAYALAAKGHRILLLDADPLTGLSFSLGAKVAGAKGLSEFVGQGLPIDQALTPTRLPTLKILPYGRLKLGESVALSDALSSGEIFGEIKEHLAADFDFMLIDVPAGIAGSALGALLMADSFLSPIQATPLSLRTIPRMLEALHWLHSQRDPFEWSGFVLNMWSPERPLTVRVAQEIFSSFPSGAVWRTVLPVHSSIGDASMAATPLALLSQRLNPMVSTFQELSSEFEAKWNPEIQDMHDEPLSLVG